MSRDLTIRLLGRPQVSTDKTTGFRKLVRKYVVEGPRASKAGIEDSTNPLFLASGASDEEFDNYYLTNQALAPANGTLDKAYLHREFIELSSSAISEAFQQSKDLIRVRKRFAVLRNDDANLGYGSSWSNHPSQATTYAQDPWEYAPSWVANATPGSRNYTVTNADDQNQHGFADAPQIDGQNLGTYISSHASTGNWLKGYAVMSQAGSGLDVWTVEWVTHAAPYWQLGTGSGRRSKNSTVSVVGFDNTGLYAEESIASSGNVSYATRAMTYTFFVKGSTIPSELAIIGGGSASVSFSPTVSIDYAVTNTNDVTSYFRSVVKGSVWDNSINDIVLKDQGGTDHTIGTVSGNKLTFDWSTQKVPQMHTPTSTPVPIIDSEGNQVLDWAPSKLINFRGSLITAIKGNISWTMTKASYSWSSSSGTFDRTSTQITPIFSHGSEKIWRVAITYVGG